MATVSMVPGAAPDGMKFKYILLEKWWVRSRIATGEEKSVGVHEASSNDPIANSEMRRDCHGNVRGVEYWQEILG